MLTTKRSANKNNEMLVSWISEWIYYRSFWGWYRCNILLFRIWQTLLSQTQGLSGNIHVILGSGNVGSCYLMPKDSFSEVRQFWLYLTMIYQTCNMASAVVQMLSYHYSETVHLNWYQFVDFILKLPFFCLFIWQTFMGAPTPGRDLYWAIGYSKVDSTGSLSLGYESSSAIY